MIRRNNYKMNTAYHPLMRACEIVTTGWCPFNCAYCYIPKTDYMKKLHEKIVEDLESGEFFDRLEQVFGNKLQFLGFWGTEPTLTLPLLGEKLDELFKRQPEIKDIGFSTGLMTDPQILVDFALKLAPRPLKFGVQISVDGPPFITDTNREVGIADSIPQKLAWLVKELNKHDFGETKIEFRWKATHSPDNMKQFVDNPDLLDDYHEYFYNLNDIFKNLNKNENVSLRGGTFVPTLMVPGKYTSEDGKLFTKYLKIFNEKEYSTTYTHRLLRVFDNEKYLKNRHQFSCSGGDSNFGMSRNLHMCHRTFYYDEPEYLEAVMTQNELDNWDVSLFKKGSIDNIKKNFIIDLDDQDELTRFEYTMRGYHDFWQLQLGYVYAMVKELALAGQADPIYLEDDDLATLFAVFINVATSCPMENVLNTGSIHLQVISLIRLFSNGAFQYIFEQTKEMIKDKSKRNVASRKD